MGIIAPPVKPGNSTPGYARLDAALLPNTRAAIAKVLAKTKRMKVCCLGDSTTAGVGAGTAASGNVGARPFSYPEFLAKYLAARGLPVTTDSFQGFANGTGEPAWDARATYGAGWGGGASDWGGPLKYNNSTTTSLSFTPLGAFDTFEMAYVVPGVSGATFTVSVDGSVIDTINTSNAAASYSKKTYNVTRGTHTISWARTGVGTDCYIGMTDCYDSAAPAISIYNAGHSGISSTQLSSSAQPWSVLRIFDTWQPDLTILDCGINDSLGAITPATYSANMQLIINKARLYGDIVLKVPVTNLDPNFPGIVAAMKALAAANNIPLIDIGQRFGSYAQANASGLYFDGRHLKAPGYADVARAVAGLFDAI